MKYPEYQNNAKVSIVDFRHNMADVIEVMEESGKPLILTRRGVPIVFMQPVSLKAYRNMKKGIIVELAQAEAIGNINAAHQLTFMLKGVEGKIALLTNNSKNLKIAQNDIQQILRDSMPQYQEFLFSPEDSAMLESNMSVGEAEADKQEERSVVSPAKSVTKKKKTSAKSDKLPPRSGGKSLGDHVNDHVK
jgi:antitoxin (DNA-binding transcriptional repressor) of toxin-antitoxin stability system